MLNKRHSHGKIGEASVTAKCWMHGIPAYNTAGLRANFAGSDLLVDTPDPRKKLLVQVKTGYWKKEQVYLTQCAGECDLENDKFVSDFIIFVNMDPKIGSSHQHEGTLSFEHLSFFVVPRDVANAVYKKAVRRDFDRPLKKGGKRKLGNMAVVVPLEELEQYKDSWRLIRGEVITKEVG